MKYKIKNNRKNRHLVNLKVQANNIMKKFLNLIN